MPKGEEFTLDDGRTVTTAEVAALAGVTMATARRRVMESTDPDFVLAPRGVRVPKAYTLTDGSTVTAEEVAAVTGLGFESAKYRLQRVRDPEEVFRPHQRRKIPVAGV